MSLLSALLGSKAAVTALTVGTITLGGTATAACAGVLPAPLQDAAHVVVAAAPATTTADASDAPETEAPETEAPETEAPVSSAPTTTAPGTSTPSTAPSPSTTTPVLTGPAAKPSARYGLCTALGHGGLPITSKAYASLAAAAGGTANLPAFCVTVIAAHHVKTHGHHAVVPTTPAPTTTPTAPATHAPAKSSTHGSAKHAVKHAAKHVAKSTAKTTATHGASAAAKHTAHAAATADSGR